MHDILQASFPPYLFECLTAKPFDESKCRSVVGDGLLTFYLPKLSQETWGELESPDMSELVFLFLKSPKQEASCLEFFAEDKEKMRQHREDAIARFQAREEERAKERAEAKRLNEKFALNEMMRVRAFFLPRAQCLFRIVTYK